MISSLSEFDSRNLVPEQMDDPELHPTAHEQALRGLVRLNMLSLTIPTMWEAIRSYIPNNGKRALRILDLATGAGDLPIKLAEKARREGIFISIDGCDISPRALAFAQRRARRRNIPARFFQLDLFSDEIPAGYDVIVSSLFLHHLREEALIELLKRARGAARKLVVMNDLRRTFLGWFLAYAASRLVSRSSIVHFDAPQSVRAAYSADEMKALANRAGLKGAAVRHIWPCRFMLTWRKE